MNFRVPFSVAIAKEELLAGPWRKLSKPQQVILKAFYGLPLADAEEQRIWNALQGPQWSLGDGVYDELGYLVGTPRHVEYVPKEHSILTGNLGRRAGKSTVLTAFIGAYEIGLGGYAGQGGGIELKAIYVAQDMNLAQTNMRGIVNIMAQSPMLSTLIPADGGGTEQIKFTHGITLEAMSNTIKAARGYAIVFAVLDELGFWYKDAKAANPDKEVAVAIDYAMQQFGTAKQVRITTPWTKEGLAYEAFVAGTEGRNLNRKEDPDGIEAMEDHLVVYAPTAAMGIPEPLVTRKKLSRKRKQDPLTFARESLAVFIDAQMGFLNHGRIADAVEKSKTLKLLPDINVAYVAVMDPAFRSDDYTLTILHKDQNHGIVQDFVQGWSPEPGLRLNPSSIMDEVKRVLDAFHLSFVVSDQFHNDTLSEMALDRDFAVYAFDMTKTSKPKVMQELATKLNAGQLVLQDHRTQTLQLQQLQRTALDGGGMKISAPPGKQDDYAMGLALGVYMADKLPVSEAKSAVDASLDINRHNKSVKLKEFATKLYEDMLASGDPQAHSVLEHSAYLRALVEDSDDRTMVGQPA